MREFNQIALFCLITLGSSLVSKGQAPAQPLPAKAPPARRDPAPLLTDVPKTNELELAVKKLRPADNFRVDLFAAEPMIQNPVSFTFDTKGRAYVVETHRRRTSVFDIRNHLDWLDEDFSFRTVNDRSNFFRKILVPENKKLPREITIDRNGDGKFDWHDLEVESERVRIVEDINGDGVADHATTFAEDFKTLVSGVAAGVVARRGDVYFTCIPDLWLLRDANNDGVADIRQRLMTGFGVHISFGGHDLHGLRFGPDGKLYFTVGDRGLHVVQGNRTIENPDSGAVLRCNPNGTDLELYATGLRNPQDLAFDQYGNLFTGDNNGDGGDPARFVYVVEGGEYGWRLGWQHLPKMGAWNAERLWDLPPTNTAAWLLPPAGHVGHGPAGLTFNPGTGMPSAYQNHFFMCDFPGGVLSFATTPVGAGFNVSDIKQFLWDLYPVDVEFGPGPGVYVLDWVQGWDKTGKGRIFHAVDKGMAQDQLALQAKQLLALNFDLRTDQELLTLLGYMDSRVRQEAQFTLASRGLLATNILAQALAPTFPELGRIHAIWALGQIGMTQPSVLSLVQPLIFDNTSFEVRAQALKVLGDARYGLGYPDFLRALRENNPRVRYFAALAVGKMRLPESTDALLGFISDNNDADPYLRHAGVMGLTWLNDINSLETASHDNSPSVRLAALLAMRRLQRPEIALFLYDSKPSIVTEAARAIYDVPIASAMSQLAALINKGRLSDPAMRRVLHANYRQGKLENAMALSEFANQTNAPVALRAEAIDLLGRWAEPPRRDLLVGLWRPLPPREARGASLSLRSELPSLLEPGPAEIRIAAIQAAVRLGIDSISGQLFDLFANKNETAGVRLEALRGLTAFKAPRFNDALKIAMADSNPAIRNEAVPLQVKADPAKAFSSMVKLLDAGTVAEKQKAIEMLGDMQNPAVDPILVMWLDRVITGKAPKEIQMEILEAAAKRTDPLIKGAFERYINSRGKENPLDALKECQAGGDAEAGRKIYFERQDVACLKCHKIKGEGGEVGPDLTGIGSRADRQFLLESIAFPNARITQGYENLVITMKDGVSHIGVLKSEDGENVIINSPEDGLLRIPKAEIQNLELGLSAMPADIAGMLSKRDLRDLVEFLANQK